LATSSNSVAGRGASPWRDNGWGPWIARVCSLPIPAVAGCDADVVTNSLGTPLASSTPPSGAYAPGQFHSGYNLPTSAPNAQTIGIVDAYDDPNIASDLTTFDNYYGLPACTTSNGCFTKVNQSGGTSYPSSDSGWALEISLDVETVHAICQNCKILLVEASSASFADLGTAENEAVTLGATAISNSWGGSEYTSETSDEASYFHHPGVAITAAAGDAGYGVEFPAASQYVTAVGGTTLNLNSNGSYGSESVWSGTGSGCSQYEPKPAWQHDAGCSKRTVNDVGADADPNTGAAVFDSVRYSGQSGWFQVGGTSLATPLIAAVYALAGTATSDVYGSAPYGNAGLLHDVTTGSDGSCSGSYLCTAGVGYDGPTGLGTPNGVGAFSSAPATVPGAPTGLAATAGNGSVALSWTAPSSSGGSAITGYDIYRGTATTDESTTPLATVTSGTTYIDTTVSNGTTYYYEVRAVNGIGVGAASNEASAAPAATVPGAPTGLAATAGNGSVALSWTAPSSSGGSAITGYDIYRGTAQAGESTTPLATVTSGTTYTDTTASNGTTYYYKVGAVNGIGVSPLSNEASAAPQAPAAGDFSLGISPSSHYVGSSGSVTYTVTITPSNGFSGTVSLSVTGLPAGVSASFSPNPATSSSTLTLTSSGARFGRATFTITGTSGSLSHSTSASLQVF